MSNAEAKNILIIGIGNSGRGDDGLGWLMLDHLKKNFVKADFLYRYQLQIEDAELLSHYSTVIFIDATKENTEKGFYFKLCQPNEGIGLTSHMLEPGTIVWLENELYKKNPTTFILGIEGEKWELSLEPSKTGMLNFSSAKAYLSKKIHLILAHKDPCTA